MFKSVANEVWAFDAEWVPDPAAGRVLNGLPESISDQRSRPRDVAAQRGD